MTDHRPCRALLVEDDPVSAAFLEAALARVPIATTVAHDCASARTHVATSTFDLWLVDANLPDGRGDALLVELRARGRATPAVAHTAARDAGEHERLLAAGFLKVLVKPLGVSEIVAAVRMALGVGRSPVESTEAVTGRPIWDDASALKALLGDRRHLDALRGLFRPELDGIGAAVSAAATAHDGARLRALLHRLRASCGFVGAVRLGDAAARLAACDGPEELDAFLAIAAATRDQFPEG